MTAAVAQQPDPLFLQSTDTLADLSQTRFYPADIEVSHHQLRNFISTFYDDKIFYVNKYDIYVLDLTTQTRSILVTIPFEARCLSAAHGWVCVGGETRGDCAFVNIGEIDVEDSDGLKRKLPGNFAHELIVEMLGKEIVNAMTVQLLKPDPLDESDAEDDETEDEGNTEQDRDHRHTKSSSASKEDQKYKEEVVVLISNNDRTVTIYSLTQRTILTTIEHPRPMNYAVLSPDSTLMAAVGDENKVYFLKRSLVHDNDAGEHDVPPYPAYDWRPIAAPDVPPGIPQHDDFSFAVAFSPDARLCAVSSQGGAITVFDMDLIEEQVEPAEAAIMCTFRSSRASLWGCVRSMAFCPGPWDVLAWAEDHGRIGLADVRQDFMRRQHLELSKDKTKKVEIKDVTPQEWRNLDVKERLRRQHQQRMQALRGQPPLGARSLSDSRQVLLDAQQQLEESRQQLRDSRQQLSNARQQQHTIQEQPQADSSNLSDRERSVISALSTTMDQVGSLGPFSINYTAANPTVRASTSGTTRREYEVQLLNPSARPPEGRGPRRRSSVVLSETQQPSHLGVDDSARMAMTASPGPISDDAVPPLMSTNDLTPTAGTGSNQPLPYNIPPSDPWHVIEASLGAARRDQRPTPWRQQTSLHQLELAMAAERALGSRLERQLNDERRLSTVLRSELEARERMLEARTHDLHSEDSPNGRISPSLERLLQSQLHTEHDRGVRRSEELEVEIRNLQRRFEQLRNEQEALLRQHPSPRNVSSPTSARTSVLPTTIAHTDATSLERRIQSMDEDRLLRSQRIQTLEHEVRRAQHRINLASVDTSTRARAPAEANDQDDPPFVSSIIPPSPRTILDINLPPRREWHFTTPGLTPSASVAVQQTNTALANMFTVNAELNTNPDSSDPNRPPPRRPLGDRAARGADPLGTFRRGSTVAVITTTDTNASIFQSASLSTSNRVTISRPTDPLSTSTSPSTLTGELAHRVTDSDFRLARMMMAAASSDANGNWSLETAQRRMMSTHGSHHQPQSQYTPQSHRIGASYLRSVEWESRQRQGETGSGGGGRRERVEGEGMEFSIEEFLRESGVGTAGVGWNRDGLRLYAGTEQGIFEFKLNILDRLQNPVVEMR